MLTDSDSRIVESRIDSPGGDGAHQPAVTLIEDGAGAIPTPPMEAAWLRMVGPADGRHPGRDDTGIFPHDGKGD